MSTNETPDRRDGEFQPGAFIARARWQQAARPFRDPHEYAIRGRGDADPDEHDAFIRFIEENGRREKFEGRPYTYADLDGFTYWVSRAVYGPPYHPIINRRPIEAADA